MSTSHLDIHLKSKADFYIQGIYSNFKSQNYGEALACYKMAKCILQNFDQDDKVVWSKILYDMGNYFKSVSNVDSAIYCLDKAIEIYPEWDEAHYARSSIIKSPLDHNTQINVDRLYANTRIVDEYLCPERISFYSDFFDACIKLGINFNGRNIADVGCGPGLLLQIIAEKSNPNSLTGFDFSTEAIKVANKKCPFGNFHQFDIYSTHNESFDLVLCTETLEHLLYPEKAMQNLISMISPMGQLILCVPNGRLDTFEGHINFWSPESWSTFIERTSENMPYTLTLLNGRHNVAIIKHNGARK